MNQEIPKDRPSEPVADNERQDRAPVFTEAQNKRASLAEKINLGFGIAMDGSLDVAQLAGIKPKEKSNEHQLGPTIAKAEELNRKKTKVDPDVSTQEPLPYTPPINPDNAEKSEDGILESISSAFSSFSETLGINDSGETDAEFAARFMENIKIINDPNENIVNKIAAGISLAPDNIELSVSEMVQIGFDAIDGELSQENRDIIEKEIARIGDGYAEKFDRAILTMKDGDDKDIMIAMSRQFKKYKASKEADYSEDKLAESTLDNADTRKINKWGIHFYSNEILKNDVFDNKLEGMNYLLKNIAQNKPFDVDTGFNNGSLESILGNRLMAELYDYNAKSYGYKVSIDKDLPSYISKAVKDFCVNLKKQEGLENAKAIKYSNEGLQVQILGSEEWLSLNRSEKSNIGLASRSDNQHRKIESPDISGNELLNAIKHDINEIKRQLAEINSHRTGVAREQDNETADNKLNRTDIENIKLFLANYNLRELSDAYINSHVRKIEDNNQRTVYMIEIPSLNNQKQDVELDRNQIRNNADIRNANHTIESIQKELYKINIAQAIGVDVDNITDISNSTISLENLGDKKSSGTIKIDGNKYTINVPDNKNKIEVILANQSSPIILKNIIAAAIASNDAIA